MSRENQQTVQIYQKTASQYLANSVTHDQLNPDRAAQKRIMLEKLLSQTFSNLPVGAKILEIGSADGANASYLTQLGYDVTASDIAPAFISACQKQNLPTIKLNALEDDYPDTYAGIFCWRTFVHFTTDDAATVLRKVNQALTSNGIFLFNALNANLHSTGEEWLDFPGEYHMGVKRYYHYFHQSELNQLAAKTGFQIQAFHTEGGNNNDKWLVYTLKKQSQSN